MRPMYLSGPAKWKGRRSFRRGFLGMNRYSTGGIADFTVFVEIGNSKGGEEVGGMGRKVSRNEQPIK